jgi:hypothetical protein
MHSLGLTATLDCYADDYSYYIIYSCLRNILLGYRLILV